MKDQNAQRSTLFLIQLSFSCLIYFGFLYIINDSLTFLRSTTLVLSTTLQLYH